MHTAKRAHNRPMQQPSPPDGDSERLARPMRSQPL